MKINYIYIDGYKNLNKLEVSFDNNSTVNALIGNNGSGKSNVIEALTNELTEEQKQDFELIKRQYKHVVDIMTYDDLLFRLGNIIKSLKLKVSVNPIEKTNR